LLAVHAVDLEKGAVLGFEAGDKGRVNAFAGDYQATLVDRRYTWCRPMTADERRLHDTFEIVMIALMPLAIIGDGRLEWH
jgi:TPP-dependent trihydroxycyclohexane-1,2-dione (THcHDO) dehydratase